MTAMNDPKAVSVIQKFELLKSERSSWERNWQDIRELVRPTTADFQGTSTPGRSRVEQVMDGTAREAAKELAAALHSYMSSPTERWFSLKVEGEPALNADPVVLAWLEEVADAIYAQYSNDRTGLTSALHETYMDVAAFGSSVLNQEWDTSDQCLSFRTHPLADCFFQEDYRGRINGLFRCLPMTAAQIMEQFPDAELPDEIRNNKGNDKWDVIHAVYPRGKRDVARYDAPNKAIASCWVLRAKQLLLKESGYDGFPYHVARWNKIAGEVYGRGPTDDCLPDIRMLQRMEFTIIKAGQKQTDPPLVVPNDGFMLPLKTGPGSLIFKEPGADEIQVLEHKGNLPWAEDKTQQKRDFIRQCFFADWVKLMPKKERQTAYEISELVEQQLRMMAPMLGRLQTELLSPMIDRSYYLLKEHRRLPDAPAMINGMSTQIIYESAAARAQAGTKRILMGKFLQDLLPVAQVDPDVLDIVDTEKYARELAQISGVSQRVLRSPEEVAQRQANRKEQQDMAAMAATAEPASKALKNVADANAVGNVF